MSFRQLLCPALIQLLGSPLNDLNKRPKTVTPFPEEINRGGRGTGNFAKSSSVVGPIPRTIYNIATELLRLVGPLAAMRPVLESLFHRIILYPPAQQRAEALKALKEVQWIRWSSSLFLRLAFWVLLKTLNRILKLIEYYSDITEANPPRKSKQNQTERSFSQEMLIQVVQYLHIPNVVFVTFMTRPKMVPLAATNLHWLDCILRWAILFLK